MKIKNATNKKRIEELEREVKRLWEVLDEVSIQARRGESAWNFQRPIGTKFKEIPISPEFPDMGKITVIDTGSESSSLSKRVGGQK